MSTETVPKGYKRTEVGVIPEDWVITDIGELTDKVGSGTTPKGGNTRYQDSGRPFVRSQNVGWGRLDLSDVAYIDENTHSAFSGSELSIDDVLLNITGASIGRSSIADTRLAGGNVNQHVCIIRVKNNLASPRLINFLLLSNVGQNQIWGFQAGGNRQGLNFKQVRSIQIPVPRTIHEQQAIAAALSDADALIESLESLLAKKRQIKQGAMQELLTGKRRLPGFTGKWETRSIGDLFAVYGGVSASRDQLSSSGHCYLHYGDIHVSPKNYISVFREEAIIPKLNIPLGKVSPTSLLKTGDVVFVDASEDDAGTSKHFVVFNEEEKPFISGLHTIVAKPKDESLDHTFKRYAFQTVAVKSQFKFYAVGTKVSGVSKSNIVKIELTYPTLPEQTAIASVLSDMDAELEALEAKLDKARQVKQGMMQQLLTGKVRLV